MEAALPKDPEFQANLEKTKAVAIKGGVGYPHFMQVCRYPVGSLYVTKVSEGEIDGVVSTGISMHVEGQGENYPKRPGGQDEIRKEGYRWYISDRVDKHLRVDDRCARLGGPAMTYKEYYRRHSELCLIIDDEIRQYHGIMCYEDGNRHNLDYRNVFFMHVCDIINIFVTDMMHMDPVEFEIPTNLLHEVPKKFKNKLTDNRLTEDQRLFLLHHCESFYTIYGYYGNYSFMGIRTKVNEFNEKLRRSSFFMNDEFFVKHQKGKITEHNRYKPTNEHFIAYRSV
jgi:hypothetical protein